MPEAWVRGAIVVRLSSLMRGHSGVRWEVLEKMQKLFLENNVTPVVPVRSSISASGDLSPLSYVAGALAGRGRLVLGAGANPGVGATRVDDEVVWQIDFCQRSCLRTLQEPLTGGGGASNADGREVAEVPLLVHGHEAPVADEEVAFGVEVGHGIC